MHSKLLPLFLLLAVPGFSQDTAGNAGAPSTWDSRPFSLVPKSFQKDPNLDVIVVTEMSKEARALPTPSAAHPTYILVQDSGERTEGDPVGGERQPKTDVLRHGMLKALAVNGYIPADALHPATQIVNFVWGSFNALNFTGEGDDLEQQNVAERAALVGGLKFSNEYMKAYLQGGPFWTAFKHRDPHTEWLCDRAGGDLYFIMATAYDIEAAKNGVKKPLWQTKMSTDSNGITMDESVPTLVVNSGAFFGRPTNGASRLSRPVIRDGQVEIGTPVEVDNGPGTPSHEIPAPQK